MHPEGQRSEVVAKCPPGKKLNRMNRMRLWDGHTPRSLGIVVGLRERSGSMDIVIIEN
jgi:hypothetical protein